MKWTLIILIITMSVNVSGKTYPKSDHYDGEVFFNPGGPGTKNLWDVLQWKWNAEPVKWPEHVGNKAYGFEILSENRKAVVTFINHATFLLQLPGLTILTDPLFSERASPFTFAGPKRARNPGMDLETLPPIDLVLISHNHYDHMDLESLKYIDGKFHPLFIVPLGDEELLKSQGLQNVKEMDWWEETLVKDTKITFTPAQHWSSRSLWDKCKSLWGGYMIGEIFFAGDTGYGGHFKEIQKRLGAPRIALLPIGAYEPRYFMKDHHMNPQDAVEAHLDLQTKKSIGMHFGTFQLTDEGIDDPVKKLIEARTQKGLIEENFTVLDHGESYSY
jgi:L-ascorbate metabolism protein UlaG (beta-lactamase superfamily)